MKDLLIDCVCAQARCTSACVPEFIYVSHVCRYTKRPEEGAESPVTRITGYKEPYFDTGNQTASSGRAAVLNHAATSAGSDFFFYKG